MGREVESQETPEQGQATAQEVLLRCDFCGIETAQVRRVALDRDYDRLQKPHTVQYACEACSRRKERERTGS